MIIAYDLRYASDHFAGVGKHAYSLIDSLIELPSDDRYVVLWDPRERNSRFDFAPLRAHPRVTWVERPYHAIHPFGTVQVGGWLRYVRPDVYLSPFSLRPVLSLCPEVLTVHDVSALRVSHIPSHWAYLLYKASLRFASGARGIVTVSEFSRREILELMPVSPARVRAILNGVPRAASPLPVPVRPASLRAERFALVVGDNRPRKNLEVLARAWRLPDGPMPLSLVGVGPVDPRFPTINSLAGVPERGDVEHVGWVTPGELAWLYAHAELVLLPSTYEGFGFPLLEAMTAGTPALVSDIPVFREVGGTATEFAVPHDPHDWARQVRTLSADPVARERLRRAGTARAGQLDYATTATATLDFLMDVVNDS